MEYFSNCPLDISKKKQLVSSSFCGGASLGVSVTSDISELCMCARHSISHLPTLSQHWKSPERKTTWSMFEPM